jgi:hypothetical protein
MSGNSCIWGRGSEVFNMPRASPAAVQPPPEMPSPLPQDGPVAVSPYGSAIASLQEDKSPHAHMLYSHMLAFANDAGNQGPTTATRPEYPPAIVDNIESVPEAAQNFANPANPAPAADRIGAWAIEPYVESNMAQHLGVANMVDISATYGVRFNLPYVRRTKTGRRAPVSAPPQTFEGDPDTLASRLIDEGVDPDVVDIIRRWIFVHKVTEQALKAPIESRDLSLKYGGVRVMWQLLLQEIEVTPGEPSYCCRLCPLVHRPEYKNATDVLRHLKRDHFGLSIACQYW